VPSLVLFPLLCGPLCLLCTAVVKPVLPEVVAAAAAVGAALTDDQLAALDRYRALLLDWNRRVNLTAVRDPAAFERLHLVDAVGLLRVVSQAELAGARLVDVGSGAGLPGVPLAILAPGLRVTLIEATGKKVAFLRAAVAALGLREVEVLHGRAEELAHRVELRERFHLATARAVAELATLVELCLPFLRLGGRLLAAKKIGIAAEIAAAGRALALAGGELAGTTPLDLPGLADRQVVVVRKVRPTTPAYPRRPGLPARQPL
jgi:16S rRNA (guanine527-N7)-methyltransferase